MIMESLLPYIQHLNVYSSTNSALNMFIYSLILYYMIYATVCTPRNSDICDLEYGIRDLQVVTFDVCPRIPVARI